MMCGAYSTSAVLPGVATRGLGFGAALRETIVPRNRKIIVFFIKYLFLIKNRTTVLMNATEPMPQESAAKT